MHAEKGVVAGEVPDQGFDQIGDTAAHSALGHAGQYVRVTLTGEERLQHLPPGHAEDVSGHTGQFDAGVSKFFLQPLGFPGAFCGQRGPVAGQVTQLRIGSGGTNDAFGRPHSASCASHTASATSVLRPGRPLACAALTRMTFSASSIR